MRFVLKKKEEKQNKKGGNEAAFIDFFKIEIEFNF